MRRSRRSRGSRCIRRMKQRAGSAMVESAIYFPIILLAAMFTIYMMINLYTECAYRAHMHETVRAKSAESSGTYDVVLPAGSGTDRYRAKAGAWNPAIKAHKKFAFGYLEAGGSETVKSGRLTGYRQIRKQYASRAYLIDETRFIW